MRRVTVFISLVLCAIVSLSGYAADKPNILVLGEDADQDSIARDSRVYMRVLNTLVNQMHDNGFDVYDETFVTLSNFEQGNIRRTDAEVIDVARSIKRPPIDVALIFTMYADKQYNQYTTRVNGRVTGRLLNVKSGQRLGNFEISSDKYANAPQICQQECMLEVVGDSAIALANDLGAVLVDKLTHLVGGEKDSQGNFILAEHENNMTAEYEVIFDGFTPKVYAEIEEYLLVFSGYLAHRPIETRYTRTDIWYKTTAASAKLVRNINMMLEELNIKATVNFSGNRLAIKRITQRERNSAPLQSGAW